MIKSLPNLYSFLKLPEASVSALLTNLDYFYTSKCQPKIKYGEYQRKENGDIKYRELDIPAYLLKSRQKFIAELLNIISLPQYMFGSIKGKTNILNAKRHIGNKYFFTIDLKDFFSNISHFQVYNMLCKNGFSPSVSRILTQLTTYKSSLPQGAPSSPVIGNLVLKDTSDRLHNLAEINKITFTTFLDDFTFSSNKCFRILTTTIIDIIKRGGFFPSHDKIHYRKEYCEITGLFLKGNILELPYQMKKRAKTNHYLRPYQKSVYKSKNILIS